MKTKRTLWDIWVRIMDWWRITKQKIYSNPNKHVLDIQDSELKIGD